MQKDEKKKTTFDVCPDGRKKEKKNTKNGLITFFDAINLMINYIRHLCLFVIWANRHTSVCFKETHTHTACFYNKTSLVEILWWKRFCLKDQNKEKDEEYSGKFCF